MAYMYGSASSFQVAFNAASLARQRQYSLRDIPSSIFNICIKAGKQTDKKWQ